MSDIDAMREALRGVARIELGQSFSLSHGVVQTAQIYTSASGSRWRKVGPLLVAPTDNPTRAGLLTQLAQLVGGAS